MNIHCLDFTRESYLVQPEKNRFKNPGIFFYSCSIHHTHKEREKKATFSNVCNTIKTGLIEAFWKLTLMWRCSHLHSINSLKQWNIWSNRVIYTTKHDAMQLTMHLSINAYIHFYMAANEVLKKSYKWHPDEVNFFSTGRTKKEWIL